MATAGVYRPFRKKRFVKATKPDEEADLLAGADEDALDEAERARLGEEASNFYSQLLSSSSSSSSSSASSSSTRGAYHPLRPLSQFDASSSSSSTPTSSASTRDEGRSAKQGDDGEASSCYYCATCGEKVPESMPPTAHRTSTVHVLCSAHRSTPTYGIPPNNVGFQMLLHKFDWEQDRGLGPEGEGRLAPVPTRLRAANDRRGVGHEAMQKQPLRITHTKPRHGIREEGEEEEGEGEEKKAPLLPNEALALGGAQMTEEERQAKKKRKKKQKTERRRKKQQMAELQQRRDQGLREAVYNEWPVLLAP